MLRSISLLFLLVGCQKMDCLNGCDKPSTDDQRTTVETSPAPLGQPGPKGSDGQSCTVDSTGLVTCGNTTYQIPVPKDGKDGVNGRDGESCFVAQIFQNGVSIGVSVTCPDGTQAVVYNGVNGRDGTSCSLTENTDHSYDVKCGAQTATIHNGIDGNPGTNGINGQNCSVAPDSTGAVVTCPDGTTTQIFNGIDGQNGTDGQAVTTVKLCSDSTSSFPEYGIAIGGSIYAVYYGEMDANGNPASNGHGTLEAFLTKLMPGAYVSTNGTGCAFSVNQNGTITH